MDDDAPPVSSLERLRRRYDRLAPIYRAMEWVLFLPPGIRRQAVAQMELGPGDSAVEVGVGTGRNLPHLVGAVGPTGRVVGFDLSGGMLARARRRCARRGWGNVELIEADAAGADRPAGCADGVLFALSYAAIPDHDAALDRAWAWLKPGGRLVVLDARLTDDLGGRIARPFVLALSRATVLGDPDKRAWEDLRRYTGDIEMTERLMGAYFICRARKPAG
ncbi:MAG: methyltransferase domain-containing protein [Planctomycetota bacterium]|nr:MAG: methyltransferase domain-containing protein [Planctomycetota bacterium]